MLTAKENMRRTVFGGEPDRFVNQYEAISLAFAPSMMAGGPMLEQGGEPVVNAWGITNSWPEGTPGQFPVHTPELIVIKDIENWREYVKAPSLEFPQEMWDMCKGMIDAIDGNLSYKAVFIAPGL
ncbi:MAG: uroporphyrinogen decarboxylase, partial [Coriobacteriia bacterium]|nr:uroporphyrinogen decarboxylase [Coriobacteriia bacterium]